MTAQSQTGKKTVALIILDGFGYSDTSASNAIEKAYTPTWDRLWSEYPKNLIETSGLAVGLPDGQMGNSEVGHMNLGAGRIVYQNFTRISKDIEDGLFASNEALVNAVNAAKSSNGRVHIFGLASPGGVHSHEDHLIAMMEVAAAAGVDVCVHAFLDGRDTPPRSAEPTLARLQAEADRLGVTGVVSLIGRYYAMDRDNRWERVQKAYDLVTGGHADIVADDPVSGLKAAYDQGKDDEFVPATSIQRHGDTVALQDGDAVVFMNFRPDRARELTRALVDDGLESDLDRTVRPRLSDFVMLTEYAADIPAHCAYPPEALENTLGEYLAKAGRTQLRIAETEKYAHVTFFFNGGEEGQYDGEDRILVPSPKVATYDLQPEMSAPEVTEKLAEAIRSGKYDLVVCNYANGDMVGHTGDIDAAVKAVEALDAALKEVTDAILEIDGQCLITADHGNAELMVDPETGGAVTSHTVFPVPLVYVGNNRSHSLRKGRLCDIAPTLLKMIGEAQPQEMTGENLLD